MLYAQYQKSFGENFGITVCGEYDEDNHFSMDYYYPYAKGLCISSYEDISVERHAEKESYAGICDDVKVGVSLIFYLQNVISYLKLKNAGRLPVTGTSLALSALSDQGTILFPIKKNESDKKKTTKATITRNRFVPAENPSQTILEQVVPVNGANQFVTVTDNSFSDAKILAGDVLVVRTDVPAREGQTVLATTKTGKLSLLKWGADAIKKIGQGKVEDSTQCQAVVGIAVGVLRAL